MIEMTADTTHPAVSQIEPPPQARALSTFSQIDYADAFLADVAVGQRSAEQLARLVLEDAPVAVRRRLQSGWTAIGLKLGRASEEGSILGWEIRRNTRDHVLLGAGSRIGMPGELLFMRHRDALLFATFVQQHNLIARTVWAGVEPVHVPFVRELLMDAVGRGLG
jgi:hypothetical protein